MKKIFTLLFAVCLSACQNLTWGQVVTSGLVGFYPFNGNADDLVDNNHGSVFGATLSTDRFGNTNQAYRFNGSTDYIELPHSNKINFEFNNDFTISVWVKIDNNQNDQRGSNNEIVSKWNANTNTPYPYAIRYFNKTADLNIQEKIFTLRFDSDQCNHNPTIVNSCKVTTELWHHLVLLKKGDHIYNYQDGRLVGETPDGTTAFCNTKNNLPIYLGKRELNQRYFTGQIDDLSFYNRALTDTEISTLFTQNSWELSDPETKFETFAVSQQTGNTSIDVANRTVYIEVPCSVDLRSLSPTFSTSANTLVFINNREQISGASQNDFTNSVIYSLLNERSCVNLPWTVTITTKKYPDEENTLSTRIDTFLFPGTSKNTEIDYENRKIDVELNCGANIKELIALFEIENNSSAFISSTLQLSGISVNSFEQQVIYTIKNSLLCTSSDWIVNVKEAFIKDLNPKSEEYFIPNVISPNDDGHNDSLKLGTSLQGSELVLFNRYGKRVFSSSNYKNQFNGNGLTTGIYFYTIKNSCFSEIIKGSLQIVR